MDRSTTLDRNGDPAERLRARRRSSGIARGGPGSFAVIHRSRDLDA